jgi:Putative esterase
MKGAACAHIGLALLSVNMVIEPTSAGTDASGQRFEVSFPASVHPQPVTGRLFLMISHHNEPEVRLQSTWFSSPEIVGMDVAKLMPGQSATIDSEPLGTPLRSLKELPDGDYYVQAVLNVYTEFHRADGHVVWAHMDQWEGQQFNKSPGNLYSQVQKLHLDPLCPEAVRLRLSEVIPPIQLPQDTEWAKHLKIQSKLLTQFWGHPIYLGAVVLLPREYAANTDTRYPVLYSPAGHFNLAVPFGFRTDDPPEIEEARRARQSIGYETGYEFFQSWESAHFPRMIVVSLLDPTPLSDWSGGVNSANNGPYEDAIMTELIPAIEKQFRIIAKPYSRVLTGNASGGREALALQLHQPDFFGGAWIFEPWPFNFRHYTTLDIYTADNVFEVAPAEIPGWARPVSEWLSMARNAGRLDDGTPLVTLRQLSQHDAVMAGMAGGDPIGADDAILGPVGDNGYPKPLWDRKTGKIDRDVANYWRDHGDLALYVERNWPTIGSHLTDKLHLYVGEMDHFYRNHGVHSLEASLRSSREPLYGATFEYTPLKGDWQPMTNAELIEIMADYIARHAPPGESQSWMKP